MFAVAVTLALISGVASEALVKRQDGIPDKGCPNTSAKALLLLVEALQKRVTALERGARSAQSTVSELSHNLSLIHPHFGVNGTSNLLEVKPGYFMVYRIQAGNGRSSYNEYVWKGTSDDGDAFMLDNVPCYCKNTHSRVPCDRHYRSRLLDIWGRLLIDRVRVGVYMEGVERAFFEFEGRGSTYDNFFSKERLVASSYTDVINGKFNFFSIAGDNRYGRRFFVSSLYHGCPGDMGWLVVSDTNEPCAWEKVGGSTSVPLILYSKTSTKTVWNNVGTVGTADTLVISIKPIDNFC